MNLPLLYWVSEQTKDPRFAQIAKAHADTAIKAFVRENGSVAHIARFNPETGEWIDTPGGQGIGVGSSCYHKDNHNFSLIYADYYFTEAILKLCDKELFMW